MLRGFLYLLVGLGSTTIGAISGLGGGVIIKPVLDALGQYDMATIGILSGCTLIAMSIVSLTKKFISGVKFEYIKLISLSVGAILGGFVGKAAFQNFEKMIPVDTAKIIQSICLALLMIIILLFSIYKAKIKTFNVTNPIICLIAGLILGSVAVFLGIGGGPINVAVIIILFSCDAKDAAIYSIFTIFFSQTTTILTTLFTTGFEPYNLEVLGFMIVGGVLGGFLGDKISTKLSNRQVEKLFNITMAAIIAINIFNVFKVALF
ncbi:sulfite exporter TauE/SafE family protein [Candidatus Epulonipiscium viviparus]|uniref:sulfite exporter TauE/SafE family protein n=1 Tax=Candidatus Epulonipiscium viviparus TaxID=420336 RepID=UPI00273814D0|nr:sulfite exporter TauE/SafE family protein [Candidatus Epulopiscium viviparus]